MTSNDDEFLVAIERAGGDKVKVSWDEILEAYKICFPHQFHDAAHDVKEGIMRLLGSLDDRGSIDLPRGKAHWDATGVPRVPAWIKVNRKDDAATRSKPQPWKECPWHPSLEQFSRPAKVSDDSFESMRAINEFVKGLSPDTPRIPVKERSLQVLGDEKRLEDIMKTGWGSCITMEVMRCYRTWEPITFVKLRSVHEQAAIIVENRDTFHSLWRRCKELQPRSPYSHVMYGKGKLVIDSIPSITDVDPGIDEVAYFGDIDAYGLQIPVEAQQKLDGEGVAVRIVAANELYARMLDLHEATGIETQAKEGNQRCSEAALAFLAPGLVDRVKAVLSRGARVPQEILNYEEMCKVFT